MAVFVAEEFEQIAGSISFSAPKIPVISNVTGKELTGEEATSPAYWAAQVRNPVRFVDGLKALAASGAEVMLELGPDPVLTAMSAQLEDPPAAFSLLRKGQPIVSEQHRDKLHAHEACSTAVEGLAWQRAYERMVHEMLRSGMDVRDIAKAPMPAVIRETDYVVGLARSLVQAAQDVPELLACDLKLESGAQGTIKDGIAYCESVRDYVSRDLLQMILDDTEEHIDFLETQIGLHDNLGAERYGMLNAKPADQAE